MEKRRVVVTGIGIVSPIGFDKDTVWNNLISGKSGIKKIDKFDVSNFPSKIAGLVDRSENGFKPEEFVEPRDMIKMDDFILYGIAAASMAFQDSGMNIDSEEISYRCGCMIGSGIGGLGMIEQTSIKLNESKTPKVSPFFIPSSLINLTSGHVSIKFNLKGPNHAVVTACASGTHSIGDAARIIKYGDADFMLAGGTEAAITHLGVTGFASAKALSTKYNDSPHEASRPWDNDRDGFVMGEGAGIFALEEYEHAKKRGAKIYAEIVGYGMAGDAYHITSPHPDGIGAINSMKSALLDAKISSSEIGYINAHATSTPLGDKLELTAVQKIFSDYQNLKMSSTKSSIGHLLGAAGGVEAIFSVLALQNQIVPPTLNLHNPIENAKIDLVPNFAKDHKFEYAMSNSFGFGGTNATLIFKKV